MAKSARQARSFSAAEAKSKPENCDKTQPSSVSENSREAALKSSKIVGFQGWSGAGGWLSWFVSHPTRLEVLIVFLRFFLVNVLCRKILSGALAEGFLPGNPNQLLPKFCPLDCS